MGIAPQLQMSCNISLNSVELALYENTVVRKVAYTSTLNFNICNDYLSWQLWYNISNVSSQAYWAEIEMDI